MLNTSRYVPKFDVWLDWGVLQVAKMEDQLSHDHTLFVHAVYPRQSKNVTPLFIYLGRLTVEVPTDTNLDDTITFTRNELSTFLHTHTIEHINFTFSPKSVRVKRIVPSTKGIDLLSFVEREPKVSTLLWGDYPSVEGNFPEGNTIKFHVLYLLCVSHYERMEVLDVPQWAARTYTTFTGGMKTVFSRLPIHVKGRLVERLGDENVTVEWRMDRPEGKLFHGENEPYSYGLYHSGRGGKWSRARTYSYIVKVPSFARELLQHPHITKIKLPLKESIPLFFLFLIYGEFVVGDDLSGNLKLLDLLTRIINPQKLPVLFLFSCVDVKVES